MGVILDFSGGLKIITRALIRGEEEVIEEGDAILLALKIVEGNVSQGARRN